MHGCSKEAHDPSPCDQVEVWLDKCGNESETANWILANTKKCPVCTVRIEKNQVRRCQWRAGGRAAR